MTPLPLAFPDRLVAEHIEYLFLRSRGQYGDGPITFRGVTGWVVHVQAGESPDSPNRIDWEVGLHVKGFTQRFVGSYIGRLPGLPEEPSPRTRFEREEVV